jgi:hypothetical protein
MGLRFYRRVRLGSGLTLNLSRSGPSLSVGPHGARFTAGASGTRATVGLPGSGLFYSAASHSRRLAAHQGHADPLGFLLGLAIMWVFVRGVWGLMWSGG